MSHNIVSHVFQSGISVRSLLIDDQPWFVAVDVCKVLGISNSRSSLALLDTDERGVHTVDTPSSNQHEQYSGSQKTTVTVINESGLYSLILRSRKPEAKVFKKWVTSEVLPAIRRTGSYQAPQRNTLREIQEDNAARGDLERHYYPTWTISDRDLQKISSAQIEELRRLAKQCCRHFRYDRKAEFALREHFVSVFGPSYANVEQWQYADAVTFLERQCQRARDFDAQVDSLERIFWEEVKCLPGNAVVSSVPLPGRVFALK